MVLLCSDGLSGMLADTVIADVVATTEDLDELFEKLIGDATVNGGIDNITVVVARIERE